MTPLPDTLLEAVASAAVREGLADAVFTRLDTPIGRLLVVQGPNGIVRVGFEEEPEDALLAEVAAALGPRDRRLRPRARRHARRAVGLLRGRRRHARAARRPRARRTRRSGARCSRRCTTTVPPRRGRHLRRARRARPGSPRASRAVGDRLRPQPGPDRRAVPPRAPGQRRGRQLRRRRRSASARCSSSRALPVRASSRRP